MGNPSPAGEGPGAWALTGTFRVGAGLKPAPTAGCATYRPKSADQAVNAYGGEGRPRSRIRKPASTASRFEMALNRPVERNRPRSSCRALRGLRLCVLSSPLCVLSRCPFLRLLGALSRCPFFLLLQASVDGPGCDPQQLCA